MSDNLSIPPPFDASNTPTSQQPESFSLPKDEVEGVATHDPFSERLAKLPEVHDPLQYEFDLIDRFQQQYGGEGRTLLGNFLKTLKRYAGVNIPSFKAAPGIEGEHVDDEGYIRLDEAKTPITPIELIRLPIKANEELAAMSKEDKNEYGNIQMKGGRLVVGEMPDMVADMVAEVYNLTNAQKIRDDRAEGEKEGYVLRRGSYMGKDVYFQEGYHVKDPSWRQKDIFWFSMVSPEVGEQTAKELTESELREFMQATGIKERVTVLAMTDSGELTRDNYREVLKLFQQ